MAHCRAGECAQWRLSLLLYRDTAAPGAHTPLDRQVAMGAMASLARLSITRRAIVSATDYRLRMAYSRLCKVLDRNTKQADGAKNSLKCDNEQSSAAAGAGAIANWQPILLADERLGHLP